MLSCLKALLLAAVAYSGNASDYYFLKPDEPDPANVKYTIQMTYLEGGDLEYGGTILHDVGNRVARVVCNNPPGTPPFAIVAFDRNYNGTRFDDVRLTLGDGDELKGQVQYNDAHMRARFRPCSFTPNRSPYMLVVQDKKRR